jgi:two-component system chemotaxis response regulator CheY
MDSYKDKKILIADDMGFIRTSIRNILDEMGFTNISEAKDGIQALAELKRSKYDLLICDYNMPHLDGISLVRMIKGDAELKDVIVLMVTAAAEKNHIIDLQQLGISDYIIKPFTSETMEKKVLEILQK